MPRVAAGALSVVFNKLKHRLVAFASAFRLHFQDSVTCAGLCQRGMVYTYILCKRLHSQLEKLVLRF